MKNKPKKSKEEKINIPRLILRIVVVAIILGLMIFAIKIAPNYARDEFADRTNLIINNNNITRNVKSNIIIEDNTIYLSTADMQNFFDEYLLIDEENSRVITTSNTKTVVIPFEGTNIIVNDAQTTIEHPILIRDGTIYLPITDLTDIYNIEVNYSSETNIVTIDSLNRKFVQALSAKNMSVKYLPTVFSKTMDKVERGDTLVLVQDRENGGNVVEDDWIKVRTKKGELGYVKIDNVTNEKTVRDDLNFSTSIDGKVSLVWDYYSQYVSAPVRDGEIEGINVVSPSFYEITASGDIDANIGRNGRNYIEWAHANGYKVWPIVSNSELGDLDAVSNLLSSFENRSYLIKNIVNELIEAGVDGVNIDFENMYQADKDNYSRFIIELAPRLREAGLTLSVDVTAPDGSETWSLCFDRNVIGKVADYIIFMGYDQNGVSATKAGTVAGADWVELNIKKFLGQEGVSKDKLILAMPFYTRLWKESNGTLTSSVVNMRSVTIPEGVTPTWDENTKQNYMEYTQNGTTYKMWIEDEDSLKAKMDLINKYELAGGAFWSKDRESNTIWAVIADELDAKTDNSNE